MSGYRGLQLAVLLVLLAVVGCDATSSNLTTAAYNSDEDIYIMLGGDYFDDATAFLPHEVLTEVTFDLPEGTHEAITDVSGVEIDHYYIWVCLGRARIPVDPFSYNY